jgi:hypothetical protein
MARAHSPEVNFGYLTDPAECMKGIDPEMCVFVVSCTAKRLI